MGLALIFKSETGGNSFRSNQQTAFATGIHEYFLHESREAGIQSTNQQIANQCRQFFRAKTPLCKVACVKITISNVVSRCRAKSVRRKSRENGENNVEKIPRLLTNYAKD